MVEFVTKSHGENVLYDRMSVPFCRISILCKVDI